MNKTKTDCVSGKRYRFAHALHRVHSRPCPNRAPVVITPQFAPALPAENWNLQLTNHLASLMIA